MSLTFKQLKDQLRPQIWPAGQPENLIAVHDSFFNEALWFLQKAVECYRYNNVDVFPHCSTYFNCGVTVLPKPVGSIRRIYVIDRIDPDTGLEDATAIPDWCAKIHYRQVEFCWIKQYVKLCESSDSPLVTTVDAIMSAFFGVYRTKRRYSRPTDEGMAALPLLPQGFHYPQASTDASGRSPGGVWAIESGRIHLAPWIQSTETVVIEWNGIKRQWGDDDLVDDDPEFKQAVRLHVAMQHESSFGEADKAAAFRNEFYGNPALGIPGILPLLIHECEEQNRIRSCADGQQGSGSSSRGIGRSAAVFYNDTQFEYTAYCPAGKTGGPFTVVKEVGSVPSAFSISDANARASQAAMDEANARLADCADQVVTYWNTPQVGIATCPAASGETPAAEGPSVSITKDANLYSSTVSQAAADALAKTAAEEEAQASLTCTFWNAPITKTAACPTGTTGDEQEYTVGAHQFSSTESQFAADSLAAIKAQEEVAKLLVCTGGGGTFMISNTRQDATADGVCINRNTGRPTALHTGFTVQAGTFTGIATLSTQSAVQTELNNQARALAQAYAQQTLLIQCGASGGQLQ